MNEKIKLKGNTATSHVFILLVLIAQMFIGSRSAYPQTATSTWSQDGTNISSTNTGNVGIGTSTPVHKADIWGAGGSVYGKGQLRLFDTTPATTGTGGELLFSGYFSGSSSVADKIGSIKAFKSNSIAGDYSFDLGFATRLSGSFNVSEVMRLTANGNVGIGTTSPGSKLFVGSGTPAGGMLSGINVALGGNSYVAASNGIINTFIGSDQYAPYGIIGTLTNHPLGLRANNTLAMTVMPDGKVGIGTTTPTAKLDVNGNFNVTGDITATGNIGAKYQDLAEWVPSVQKLSAGTVVVLDQGKTNHVVASGISYDTSVAGVVSEMPGIILGEKGEGKVKVATTGRVKVKVDATRSPIKVGDLLVTSNVQGVAMRSVPLDFGGALIHRPGTIIGKALETLEKGNGEILVLLSLQ
jgi:hypothetical protein